MEIKKIASWLVEKTYGLKSLWNRIFVIGIFYILLYQIKTIRVLIKRILIYLNYFLDYFLSLKISLGYVKRTYYNIEHIFMLYFAMYILVSVMLMVVLELCDRRRGKMAKEQMSPFEHSLLTYLCTTKAKRCYLVTGLWGVGKTYDINNFFGQNYQFSKIKRYKVSCFGLDNRKELLQEISAVIDKGDNSFYSSIVNVISHIPVIGEVLFGVLAKKHDLNTVKKGSIFIFDDFERITSRGSSNYQQGGMIRGRKNTHK